MRISSTLTKAQQNTLISMSTIVMQITNKKNLILRGFFDSHSNNFIVNVSLSEFNKLEKSAFIRTTQKLKLKYQYAKKHNANSSLYIFEPEKFIKKGHLFNHIYRTELMQIQFGRSMSTFPHTDSKEDLAVPTAMHEKPILLAAVAPPRAMIQKKLQQLQNIRSHITETTYDVGCCCLGGEVTMHHSQRKIPRGMANILEQIVKLCEALPRQHVDDYIYSVEESKCIQKCHDFVLDILKTRSTLSNQYSARLFRRQATIESYNVLYEMIGSQEDEKSQYYQTTETACTM